MHKAQTLKKQVYDSIMANIMTGAWKSNDILTEQQLMTQFNVSKTPVREALIELCADEFVESIPRIGYQIKPIRLEEVMEIVEFREDLEISNLKHIRHYTEADLEELRKYVAVVEEKTEDRKQVLIERYMANMNFHLKLASLSGNRYAYKSLEFVIKLSTRFFTLYYPNERPSMRPSPEFHKKIVEALERHDMEAASDELFNDIDEVRALIAGNFNR